MMACASICLILGIITEHIVMGKYHCFDLDFQNTTASQRLGAINSANIYIAGWNKFPCLGTRFP